MSVFLNSFVPLCATKIGRDSVKKFGHKPFVDGSCRREPDFEKERPAITCLCRTNKLVPRLKIGDLVIYITNKRKYYGGKPERFLVAILQVEKIVNSHEQAMEWYSRNDFELSQNIICEATNPLNSEYTHHITRHKDEIGKPKIRRWDADYRNRSKNYPLVAICSIWNGTLNLTKPKSIADEEMYTVFKRKTGTQTPPKLSDEEWDRFQETIVDKIESDG